MSNEVNPIDVEALKEFLGEQLLCRIEYCVDVYIELNGEGDLIVKSYRYSQGGVPDVVSDYEAISITLSWLWDQLWDNGKNLVSVSGAYYDDDGERSLYCCTVKNHDKIESPGIHTTGESPFDVMIKAYEQYKELVK